MTSTQPVSSATFQTRPKSLRLISVSPSKPIRVPPTPWVLAHADQLEVDLTLLVTSPTRSSAVEFSGACPSTVKMPTNWVKLPQTLATLAWRAHNCWAKGQIA